MIFFDVGYTLDYPASGDWMFTKKYYELVGNKLDKHSPEKIQKAKEISLDKKAGMPDEPKFDLTVYIPVD